ncbi:PhnA domain-containing protein [Polluticoccus soli]|uniref:PhnA domain-containing protein n=1 Tax=Polluticoccus soli TaxID=3034150 RepID=UPI0023E228E2|nr:alkylphosphonate utilization protein [Flavipsychrobacter sp. JY13-12]
MTLQERLTARSENKCELCQATGKLNIYEVPPQTGGYEENTILICDKCLAQIEKKEELDNSHWSVLTTSMWSEVPGVQVASWRMLNRLKNETWASEALDMMYLDDERLAWAKATGDHENDATVELHRDANGAQLFDGDTVVLTKSLDVKGTSIKAAVGTVIRNIHLVKDNVEQIEGRIEGQMIVVLTKYVRRQARD